MNWLGRQGVQLPLPVFTVETALPFYRWVHRGVGIYDVGNVVKRLEEDHDYLLTNVVDVAEVRLDLSSTNNQWDSRRQRRYLTETKESWGLK
jgi:hypothetical protein